MDDHLDDEPLELPPPPQKAKKAGRPKGRKNTSTLQREHRAKVAAKAKKLLDGGKSVSKQGKKYIEVNQLLADLQFNPVDEAVLLYREIEADHLDADSRKLRLEVLKLLMPYTAPKLKPPEDSSTSKEAPVFNIYLGKEHMGRPMKNVTPAGPPPAIEVHMPDEEKEE